MGEKTIDKFKFDRDLKLGQGSFGEVFKGYEESTKLPVAVKMIAKNRINQSKYLTDGLMSEIKIM
jgi:serine/threonine protein kinase